MTAIIEFMKPLDISRFDSQTIASGWKAKRNGLHCEPMDDEASQKAAINKGIRYNSRCGRECHTMPKQPPTIIDFQPLLMPVPPMIEEAFGYTGSSRFVAFYWKPSPAGFCWSDSHESRHSSYGTVWFEFAQHRRVQPFIQQLNLGGSDLEAEQWLLLDRVKRLFLAGVASKVAAFLRSVPQETLSAEGDGSDFEHLTVLHVAMSAMVRAWLDEEDS